MARPLGPDYRVRNANGRGVRATRSLRPLNVTSRTHGLRSTYVDGCCCDQCRDAEAEYSRRYRAARRANA